MGAQYYVFIIYPKLHHAFFIIKDIQGIFNSCFFYTGIVCRNLFFMMTLYFRENVQKSFMVIM